MKYDDLVDFYNKEKEKDGLHPVPSDLYSMMHQLLQETRQARASCERYQERDLLDDQVRGMLQMIEGICDRRTSKILELATLQQQAGRDMLTPEELILFQAVKDALARARSCTLDTATSL
jgi:DNA replication initiation complex subunit (GINS family)